MALTRKWVELALNQAEANDASFVAPEFRESQRNYAELCRHWLATEQDALPVAWLLTDEKINDLQVSTVQTLVRRAKHAHFCNVYLRINGKDEVYQADWLKHLQAADQKEKTQKESTT